MGYKANCSKCSAKSSKYTAQSNKYSAKSKKYKANCSKYSAKSNNYSAKSNKYSAKSNKYKANCSKYKGPLRPLHPHRYEGPLSSCDVIHVGPSPITSITTCLGYYLPRLDPLDIM